MRYKVRHAWFLVGDSGTKFAMHAKNAPNWAISSEQGEFCTGSGPARFLLGEFCTGSGPARFLVGECCVVSAPSESPVVGLPPPTGAAASPSNPFSARCTGSGGVLQHEELAAGVSPACHTPNDAIPPDWWR